MSDRSKLLKILSAAGQVVTGFGNLTSLLITTDGTNNAVVTAYDGVEGDTSSPITPTVTVPGEYCFGGVQWDMPLVFKKGLYIVISGTGAGCAAYGLME